LWQYLMVVRICPAGSPAAREATEAWQLDLGKACPTTEEGSGGERRSGGGGSGNRQRDGDIGRSLNGSVSG
jgi:hypothetical protein